MIKGVLITILGLIFVTAANAEQRAQAYLNPYLPQYKEQDTAPLLEASLQKDLVMFAERRDRIQKVYFDNISPQESGLIEKDSYVFRRILDRTTARFMKSDIFRKSSLGKASDSLKEKMETDMEFKDDKNVAHHFDFKIAAFQGQAFIQYEGWTKAQLRYDALRNGQLAMIFQHDLGPQSSIGIETSFVGQNQVQMVHLNYAW